MTAALAPRTGFKFMITVRQGPDRGVSYQLLPPKVTIGRGNDNNIAFADPKVSRQAAVIDFSPERIVISDLSSRHALIVNGQNVAEASIKHGDSIQVGDTEFVFSVEQLQLSANGQPQLAAPGQPLGLRPPPSMNTARPRNSSASSSDDAAAKLRFYIVLGVVVAGAVYFLNKDKKVAAIEPEIRTNEAIEKDIKVTETRIEEITKKRTFKTPEEKTRFEEAQKHYLEGFRDYQKGQWMRAMRSFETAYTIDSEHQLAIRYYKYAEKQRDEMVALLTNEGLSYKEKNMFGRCEAAFEKVMDAIPNKDDVKYKQAQSLRDECRLLDKERFN